MTPCAGSRRAGISANKIIPAMLVAIIALCAGLYLFRERIAIFFFCQKYGLQASYDGLSRRPGEFIFRDLRVYYRKAGAGISAAQATFRPEFMLGQKGKVRLNFNLSGIRFIRQTSAETSASYNSLSELVAAPFSGRWGYNSVSGAVELVKDGVRIIGLKALGDEMRIDLDGVVRFDNTVEIDTVIYFSQKFTKKIPDELRHVVLKDEPAGWESLSVRLSGNYRTPSIQLSGRLFRLNIRSVSAGQT